LNEVGLVIADRTAFAGTGIENSSDGPPIAGQTLIALKKFERIGFDPAEDISLNFTWDIILRN